MASTATAPGKLAGSKASGEILPLTSIRGIAAFLVVLHHMSPPSALLGPWSQNLIDKGYLAVDLFFVLSGFVMALTYANLFTQHYVWSAHRDFLWRRIARIYPLYLAVTLGVSLYTLLHFGGYTDVHQPGVELADPISAHIANLLMVHGWGFAPSIGGPTWSISTEWAAYLLFPLLVQAALFRGPRLAGLLAIVASGLIIYVALQPIPDQVTRHGQLDVFHEGTALPVLRCLAGFSIGLIAFRLRQWQPLMRVLGNDLVCFALFALLTLLMALRVADLWIYGLLPLLVLSLSEIKGIAATVFSARPLWLLGVLSYSIYLIHTLFYPVVWRLTTWTGHFLSPNTAALAADLMTYAIIIGASVVTYCVIERPGRQIIRRLTEQPKPQIATLDPAI